MTNGSFMGVGVFDLAQRRLSWLEQRQNVLAQNVANADTPGYRARDIAPFAAQLAAPVAAAGAALDQTNPKHLPGTLPVGAASVLDAPDGAASEQAPDGNAVSLDDQLLQLANDDQSHLLVTQLYTKYVALFNLALGQP